MWLFSIIIIVFANNMELNSGTLLYIFIWQYNYVNNVSTKNWEYAWE